MLSQSDVRIGILATRPVADRRPSMLAKMKEEEGWSSGEVSLLGTGGGGSGPSGF